MFYHHPIFLPPQLPTPLLKSMYFSLARKGFNTVKTVWGKPDLIHAHVVFPAGWVSTKLGRDEGIPVVLTEHSGPFSMHLKSILRKRLVKDTLVGVDRIVAVSPALKNQIHNFYPNIDINIVGNVIRTDFFTPMPSGDPALSHGTGVRFLSVTQLKKSKGLDYLLFAAKLLLERGIKNFEIIIGGNGKDRRRLKNIVKKQNLFDHCRFVGFLYRPDVRRWMQRSDVFVLPSLGETFGVVLAEAMACGKPVISTRCGGPEFVVSPGTGILVDPADSGALAHAMAGFISGNVTFDSTEIIRTVRDRFGEDAFVRNISSIYNQL